ncbi:hypothetical protein CDL12_06612 [Handroanthus impetiginosus]|uniref:Putative plant transposon protein domain-containing protein n=1 Tax=Handroanthus impetiginosus TaxID=429701 RepID=A0A2G9HTR9_9LAMI|nr:hypothetical protein CDL12_06612 [Handroanthus impetiginosus]
MSGRRSSKRRQTDIASTSQGFDQRQLIGQEAADYYIGRLLDKALIRKRVVKDIDEIVERCHWEEFINDPRVANKTLLREFYANLKFTNQQHHAITVRGKSVNFSTRTINSLFGTPSINTHEELQEFLEDNPPLDTICKLICRDDPQWTMSQSISPIPITKKHAMMIFAILTDVAFDIGRFLHRSIWKSAMDGLSIGLYHPSLITTLCARAGLERQLGDELLQPDSMIAGLEERVDRLADEVHQLQLRQEQQFAHQQQ